MTDAWNQTSLDALAEEVGCDQIDIQKSGKFAVVWCVVIFLCLASAVLVTVGYRWYFVWRQQQTRRDPDLTLCRGHMGARRQRTHGMDPTPDLDAAKAHLLSSSPVGPDGNWRPIWGTPLKELGLIGGPGLGLYFRILVLVGLVFTYATICSVPVAVFSLLGSFADNTSSGLVRISIANLGTPATGRVAQQNRLVVVGCQGVPLSSITPAFGWFDFMATVTFIGFALWLYFQKVPHRARELENERVLASDFTVEVDGLPPQIADHANYSQRVEQHIQKSLVDARRGQHDRLGSRIESKVCAVVLVRDRGMELSSVKRRAKFKLQKAIALHKNDAKAVAKLDKKIAKIDEALKQTRRAERELPVLRAFVTLNRTDDVRALLHHYRFSEYFLLRCFQSERMRFEGSVLRLRRAPEPTNIIWQNQDVPARTRLCRECLVFVVWMLIMGLCLLLMYLTSKQATVSLKKYQSAEVTDICSGQVAGSSNDCPDVPMELKRTDSKFVIFHSTLGQPLEDQGQDTFNCFCSAKGLHTITGNSTLRSACQPLLTAYSMKTGISIIAAIIVVAINVAMSTFLFVIAEWELPLSVSALNSAQMLKVFVAQTLNTAGVVFLVHSGDFSDFKQGWYFVVGASICMTMATNTVSNALVYLILATIPVIKRRCTSPKGKHQAELLELYTNPPFDLASRYAYLLMTLYVTLIYSSGLPILNVLAIAYCVISYWSDKAFLLWGSSRPPQFDLQMPKQTAWYMIFAGIVHSFAAIVMYGHPCVFPSNPLGGSLGKLGKQSIDAVNQLPDNPALQNKSDTFSQRLDLKATWMISVLFFVSLFGCAVCICARFFGRTVVRFLSMIQRECCTKTARVVPESDAADRMSWEDARKRIEAETPPASYRLEDHPDFEHLAKYMDDGSTA